MEKKKRKKLIPTQQTSYKKRIKENLSQLIILVIKKKEQ